MVEFILNMGKTITEAVILTYMDLLITFAASTVHYTLIYAKQQIFQLK